MSKRFRTQPSPEVSRELRDAFRKDTPPGETEVCPACNGEGEIYNTHCSRCDGCGKIRVAEAGKADNQLTHESKEIATKDGKAGECEHECQWIPAITDKDHDYVCNYFGCKETRTVADLWLKERAPKRGYQWTLMRDKHGWQEPMPLSAAIREEYVGEGHTYLEVLYWHGPPDKDGCILKPPPTP